MLALAPGRPAPIQPGNSGSPPPSDNNDSPDPPPLRVLGCVRLHLTGPLACSPHQVDVYIMTQPLSGKWIHFGTEVTNSSGRLTFPVPLERALGIGVYPVRMVVR